MRRFWPLFLLGCYPERAGDWEKVQEFERTPVPQGNLRIRIETFEFAAEDRAAFDLAWRFRKDDVSITAASVWESNGATLWSGDYGFAAKFRTATQNYRSRRAAETSLLVAEGHEAQLHVVESMDLPTMAVVPVRDGLAVVRTLQHVVIGSGLHVKATRQGGALLLELTPYLSVAEGGAIHISELRTEVLVVPGQPIVLFAAREADDSFGATFFSVRSRSGLRKRLQVLTVEE